MGFKDKLNNLASSGKEMMANEMAIIKKQKNELSVALTLNEGKEITGNMLSNNVKLWRQSDGLVYFNNRVENPGCCPAAEAAGHRAVREGLL